MHHLYTHRSFYEGPGQDIAGRGQRSIGEGFWGCARKCEQESKRGEGNAIFGPKLSHSGYSVM